GLVGPALELVFGLAIGPLIVVGLLFGWTRASIQGLIVILVLGAILLLRGAAGVGGPAGAPGTGGTGSGPSTSPAGASPELATVGVALLAIVGIVVVLLLIRAWMRGAAVEPDVVFETRTIDRGVEDDPAPKHRRRLFRPAPTDAESAYPRLIGELEGRPIVARAP